MPVRASHSIFRFGPDQNTLKMVVDRLNTDSFTFLAPGEGGWRWVRGDSRPVNRELRRLVQAWFDSGPNVAKLLSDDPFLARLSPIVRAHLEPTKGSHAHLSYLDGPDTDLPLSDPLEPALGIFFLFLLNPHNVKLGGPCKHCGKYYVKRTTRQKVYCSKRCGLKHTSQAFIRKQRELEHQKTLHKANHYSAKWSKTNTRKGWKDWVSDNALISKHFLTRAVKNGELLEPVKCTSPIRRS